jgi:Tol biopolymer transport system component
MTVPSGIFGDVFPAFSRDGHALAFCRLKSMAVSSLYVLPLSANFEARGEPQALPTLAGQTVYSPAWTTDDREIVYSTNVSERSVLYRVAVSGGGPPRPLGLGDGAAMPALSSDGRHLAYAHFFQDVNIWRVDLSGKSAVPEQLIASTSREVFPQFSPDGKRIVFYSNSTGSDQIWLCNADGSNAAPLTSMEAAITGTPRWSPDGRQISFDSNADGFFQVYVIRADGGKPRQLTHERTSNFGASWSRDGRWIYFASQRSGMSEVWDADRRPALPLQFRRCGKWGLLHDLRGQVAGDSFSRFRNWQGHADSQNGQISRLRTGSLPRWAIAALRTARLLGQRSQTGGEFPLASNRQRNRAA